MTEQNSRHDLKPFSMARFADEGELRVAIAQVIADCGFDEMIRGRRVFVKPNLTYPFFKEGVTTSPAVLREICVQLLALGADVTVGEGEGGYNSFDMKECLGSLGLDDLPLKTVVVTGWESTAVIVRRYGFGRKRRVPVPRALLQDFDLIVSVPVPKVHSMTYSSGSVKNFWGIVQDPFRLRYHVVMGRFLEAFLAQCPPVVVLYDGTFGLTANGPMIEGIPVELGWVAGSTNPWLADGVVMTLLGLPLRKVKHVYRVVAKDQQLRDQIGATVKIYSALGFSSSAFYLNRNIWNRIAKITWYSDVLNWFVYRSRVSSAVHRIMYSFRSHPSELKVRGVDWE